MGREHIMALLVCLWEGILVVVFPERQNESPWGKEGKRVKLYINEIFENILHNLSRISKEQVFPRTPQNSTRILLISTVFKSLFSSSFKR